MPRVRITRCIYKESWYYDKVGQIFEVCLPPIFDHDPRCWLVRDDYIYASLPGVTDHEVRCIPFRDCERVEEET